MDKTIEQQLFATTTAEEFVACFERHMGYKPKNGGDLESIALFEHFVDLIKKSYEGTPFAKQKLPDGREIWISPGIGALKKKES